MRQPYICLVLLFIAAAARAQSFSKGSLLISVSEGAAYTHYTTTSSGGNVVYDGHVNGDRDPLTLEYGISPRWGLGINMGGDILHADPRAYNSYATGNRLKIITAEFTFDAHYHFFTTDLFDVSGFVSAGPSSLIIGDMGAERSQRYVAHGGLVRTGIKARYYITRRFGFLMMGSVYAAGYKPSAAGSDAPFAGYRTALRGTAIEFGFCYRLLR